MDAPHSPDLLPPEELAAFFDADPAKQLRLIRTPVLLPALGSTFVLLDISIRDVWETLRKRNPRMPVFKTIEKSFESNGESISTGTQRKLLQVIPFSRATFDIVEHLAEAGFAAPELVAWSHVFDGSIFHSSTAAQHWLSILRRVAELNGSELHAAKCGLERAGVYARAEITARLGCPLAQERIQQLLSTLEDDANLDAHPELEQLLAMDIVSTLLRVAAWWMADWQVCNWEDCKSHGRENDVLCAELISASWMSPSPSTPLQVTLEKLASKAGWAGKPKVERFLGKLWSTYDPTVEVDSRVRLLRSWLQMRKHRPSFSKFEEMSMVCQREMARLGGCSVEEQHGDQWLPASIIRVAEVLSRLIVHLKSKGVGGEMLQSGLEVYEIEYRIARVALGKPIVAKENEG